MKNARSGWSFRWTWGPGGWTRTAAIATLVGCGVTDNGSNNASGAGGTAGTGTGADSATAGDSAGGPVQEVSIYEIQRGDVPVETLVKLSNVVVTTPVQLDRSAVFVQEQEGGEYSGIALYLYTEVVDGADLAPGDVITVTGIYEEFYDSSQIRVENLQALEIVGQTEVPEPIVVAASDVASGGDLAENFESVLIRVEDSEVEAEADQYGNVTLAGGLLVAPFFWELPQFRRGAAIESVTGPLIYSFEEFRLAPRGEADLIAETVEEQIVTIYDIQTGGIPEMTPVVVADVIVTTPATKDGDTFFIQEPDGGPSSGIAVYVPDGVPQDIEPGAIVTVRGTYSEFFENSQIGVFEPGGIEVTGSTDVPEPERVEPADVATGGPQQEEYEGVLVTVVDTVVTEAPNIHGKWAVDGLWVDDEFFADDGDGEWPQPNLGEGYVSLTGVMNYSFDQARLAPRSLADIEPDEVEPAQAATVYEIQGGEIPEQTRVAVSGVVVTSPVAFGDRFFVQEQAGGEWSGIEISVPDDASFEVEIGNVVDLVGVYRESFDASQIVLEPESLTVTGTTDAPQPALVEASAVATGGALQENYEGVLVRVENVTVTAEINANGDWFVDDVLRVDDYFFPPNGPQAWPEPSVGFAFDSLTGIMAYSFHEARLAPRDLDDLVAAE